MHQQQEWILIFSDCDYILSKEHKVSSLYLSNFFSFSPSLSFSPSSLWLSCSTHLSMCTTRYPAQRPSSQRQPNQPLRRRIHAPAWRHPPVSLPSQPTPRVSHHVHQQLLALQATPALLSDVHRLVQHLTLADVRSWGGLGRVLTCEPLSAGLWSLDRGVSRGVGWRREDSWLCIGNQFTILPDRFLAGF